MPFKHNTSRRRHIKKDVGDVSQVELLLDQIDRPIGQFTADGAYDGKPTYDTVINHSADAAIVIPPHANAIEPINLSAKGISISRQSAEAAE